MEFPLCKPDGTGIVLSCIAEYRQFAICYVVRIVQQAAMFYQSEEFHGSIGNSEMSRYDLPLKVSCGSLARPSKKLMRVSKYYKLL